MALLRNFLVLPLVAVADMGVFRYAMVLSSYGAFFQGGALNTLGFRFPERAAAGDERTCEKLQAFSWQAVLAGAVLAMLVLTGACTLVDLRPRWLSLFVGAMGPLSVLNLYVASSYRVRGAFREQARNDMLAAVGGTAAVVSGAFVAGLHGLAAGAVVAATIPLILGRMWLFPPGWRQLDRGFITAQLGSSGALFASWILNQASLTVDLVMLQRVLPPRDIMLGYYAFALAISNIVYVTMGTVADVQSLGMLRALGMGQAGHMSGHHMTELMARDAFLTVIVCSAALIGVSAAVPVLLPSYRPTLATLGAFLLAAVILRWKTYPVLVLNTARRTRVVIASSIASIVVTAVHIGAATRFFGGSYVLLTFCSAASYLVASGVVIGAACRCTEGLREGGVTKRAALASSPALLFGMTWLLPARVVPAANVAIGLVVPLLSIFTFELAFPGTMEAVRCWVRQRGTERKAQR
jgi:hypothetical protein